MTEPRRQRDSSRSLRLLAAAGVLGAVTLAGCSGSEHSDMPGMDSTPGMSSSTSVTPTAGSGSPADPTTDPTAGPHNAADVTFVSEMIGHHTQAITMSDMLLAKQGSDAKGIDAKVTGLATRIKAEQTPEVTQMRGLLVGWGQNPSPSAMSGMPGMDSGDGMMSQADLDRLAQSTGRAAAQQYLTGMIAHHEGAVTMARTEQRQGQNPEAKKLAQAIVTAQQDEITQLQQLLHP